MESIDIIPISKRGKPFKIKNPDYQLQSRIENVLLYTSTFQFLKGSSFI